MCDLESRDPFDGPLVQHMAEIEAAVRRKLAADLRARSGHRAQLAMFPSLQAAWRAGFEFAANLIDSDPAAGKHRAEAWRQGHPDQPGGAKYGWDCLDCTSTATRLADALAAERGADWHSKHPHGLPPATSEESTEQ